MQERVAHKRRNQISIAFFCVLCGSTISGCGAELETALSNISLLPSAADISANVRASCDGVLSEAQMLSGIVAARFDRSNGTTTGEPGYCITLA